MSYAAAILFQSCFLLYLIEYRNAEWLILKIWCFSVGKRERVKIVEINQWNTGDTCDEIYKVEYSYSLPITLNESKLDYIIN